MKYHEVQKFSQTWLWVGLIAAGLPVILLFGVAVNRQIVHGQKFGNNPMSDQGLIIAFTLVLVLFIMVALLFGFAKLTTVIDRRGIEYRFFPFHFSFRRICWDAVEQYEVITYHPIGDYGGWGIKSNKQGKAYNVTGDKGLQLQLKTGKSLLIGTQNEPELTDFLRILAPLI